MADVLSKEQRRKNMQKIKSKNTAIERILRKALWEKGYRYRKNVNNLPGKPDIVIVKYRIAIFCDGEFFHGKDWNVLKNKLQNSEKGDFWIKKISKNIEHDNEVDKELSYMGFTVLRFWGKDIKKHTDECLKTVDEVVFKSKIMEDNNV